MRSRHLVLFLLLLPLFAASSCPIGFDLVRNGECRGLAAEVIVAADEAIDTAIAKCNEIQGKTVIIHDKEHQTYWKERAPSVSKGVMILGLVCNSSTNKWMWEDGSDVDFKPELWYDKELDQECQPNITWYLDPMGDGYWSSFDRGDSSPISAHIFCTTQLAQPQYPGGACQEFVNDGEDGRCYEFEVVEATFEDAQLACENLGANLVSIHNQQENSFVRQLSVSEGALNGFFIGARSIDGVPFEWADGSSMDFDNFFLGFPKAKLGNCLAMDTTQPEGQWMNVDCDQKLPFVCSRASDYNFQPTCSNGDYGEEAIINSPGFPYTAYTPCDFFLSVEEGMRVQLEIELLEANSCCDSLTIFDGFLGGEVLDRLTGVIENVTYTTSKSNIMRVSWQPSGGLNVRGVKLTYRAVEPIQTTTETIETTTTEDEPTTTTTVPTTTTKTYVFNHPTEPIFPACPEGFELVKDGECRGLAEIVTATPVEAVEMAIATCDELQGKPVIIHDDEHQTYWKNRAPLTAEGFLIMGIVCNEASSRYEWADGSEIDYKPLDIWYDKDLDKDCSPNVTWYLDPMGDGYWTYGESEKHYSAHIFCTTQLELPLYPGGTCQEFENDDDDGACFEIYDEPATWQDGQLACQKQGANLASIHSAQENSFLLQLARFNGVANGFFIGADTSQGDSFEWSDESEMDFDNFFPGFPKANLGDCLSMDTTLSGGQWMNVDCSAELPFACMRKPILDVVSTCSNGEYEEGAIITSPGFPYSSSTPCDFFLSAEIGQIVELEIEALEANSCCDSLTIFDGFLGGEVIAKLTGEVQNFTFITKNSNIMRVSWKPNGGVNVRGVKMRYRSVEPIQTTTEAIESTTTEEEPTTTTTIATTTTKTYVFNHQTDPIFPACPHGYELVKDGECRGLAAIVTATPVEAVEMAIATCDERQENPVIIHDDEHQRYWTNRAPLTKEGFLILGIVCNAASMKYEWADGSEIDYKPLDIWYDKDLDKDCSPNVTWYLDPMGDGYWTYGESEKHYSAHIFCTTQLELPLYPGGTCQEFENDDDDGACFEIYDEPATWKDAQLVCQQQGANLASIHTIQENSFLLQLSRFKGVSNGFFIGAMSSTGDSFAWIDESEMDFDNFYPGFPRANLGKCLSMDTTLSGGQWMNVDCSTKLPFACMRAPIENVVSTCSNGDYEQGETINSPGFPYSASTPCDFFLSAEVGQKVELEIEALEANSCCDSLTIFDGFLGGEVIAKLTGEVQNVTFTTKNSNIMRVSWQPNGGVNVRGVKMSYRAVGEAHFTDAITEAIDPTPSSIETTTVPLESTTHSMELTTEPSKPSRKLSHSITLASMSDPTTSSDVKMTSVLVSAAFALVRCMLIH